MPLAAPGSPPPAGPTGAGAPSARRILRAALWLAGATLSGLAAGALVRPAVGVALVSVPALGLQTLLTVGALPRLRGGAGLRGGLRLLALHHLVLSLPLAAGGLLLGVDAPLGFGFFVMGIAPVAALVPAYAEVLEVDVGSVLVFCLVAYGLALVAMPALLLAAAGSAVGLGPIAVTVGAGLVLPSVAGRALHPWIVRIPTSTRRVLVNACVFGITFGLGGELAEGARAAQVGGLGVALTLAVLGARTFGTGALARRLAPAALKPEAPLAGAFKNIALVAAVAGSLHGPAAALPAVLAFAFELGYFVWLARPRVARVPT